MNNIYMSLKTPVSDWFLLFICTLGIILLIVFLERLRNKLNCPPEITRKTMHMFTGTLIAGSVWWFTSALPLIMIAAAFVLLDWASIKSGWIKAVHQTERASFGTVFYPLSVLILALFFWNADKRIFVLSVLVMALADALAGIVGETLKKPHSFRLWKDEKSIEGSAVMFIVTSVVIFAGFLLINGAEMRTFQPAYALWAALIAGVFIASLEALSSRGSDNLSVPLGTAFIIHFLLSQPAAGWIQLSAGMLLAVIVSFFSWRAEFLTSGGSVAAFILAVLIFGVGGWIWSVPILTFFILSSFLSKAGKKYKRRFDSVFEKSSQRDIGQVAANGAVAGTILLLNYFIPNKMWFTAYLGSLAAVNADTWATETGILSRAEPRSVITLKRVPAGTSGGISPAGTAAAFAGAAIISACGYLTTFVKLEYNFSLLSFWAIVFAGFTACFFDSFLGATLQGQYYCNVCEKQTEKQRHCGKTAEKISGLTWFNNDRVNAICSLTGAIIAGVFFYIIN